MIGAKMGFLELIYVFRSEADKQSPFRTNEVGDWIIDIEIDRYARYGSHEGVATPSQGVRDSCDSGLKIHGPYG